MKWKKVEPYFSDYQNFEICKKLPDKFQSLKDDYIMCNLFFACFCEKRYDGTRKLLLRGNDLYSRLGSVLKHCQ